MAVADTEKIIAQAVSESLARGKLSTIAVVDRVGNVLGVFRMTGAADTVVITSGRGVTSGLEGAGVPDTLAAIAKAVTGAYLSSAGKRPVLLLPPSTSPPRAAIANTPTA